MNTNQCLYTPTNWNRECELMKDYLVYRSHFKTSVELFDEYISKGILYFGEKIMSLEEWKKFGSMYEQKGIKSFDKQSETYLDNLLMFGK